MGGDAEKHAERQRAKLDAKIAELRAAGWDVVARRERDLALSQRDEAREALRVALAHEEWRLVGRIEGAVVTCGSPQRDGARVREHALGLNRAEDGGASMVWGVQRRTRSEWENVVEELAAPDVIPDWMSG